MFDLNAGVDLEEVVVAVLVEKLDRPGVDVTRLRGATAGGLTDLLACLVVQDR